MVRRVKPDVVVGLGGYITFPGGMMSVLLSKPLVLHEQNSVAGLANKVLAGVADRVFTAFPNVLKKAQWVGNPLRAAFTVAARSGHALRRPQRAAASCWWWAAAWAHAALNDRGAARRWRCIAPAERPQVLHQSGAKQIDELRANYAAAGVEGELTPFIEDTAQAYADADLIVARAGASTVTEIAAVGAAALFVPFPPRSTTTRPPTRASSSTRAAAGSSSSPTSRLELLADLLQKTGARRAAGHAPSRPRPCRRPKPSTRVVRACEELAEMKHAIHHIHFVGVGGSGMSGIAEVLLNLGYKIIRLRPVRQRHAAPPRRPGHRRPSWATPRRNIAGADAVVTSTAVQADNPEVLAAREKRIPVVPRALMLAELMRLKQGIAIAGTHGKTTTTSLVASVLAAAGLDPTFVIGGRLNSAGANAQLGSGDYIVVEADESDASFLNLLPVMAVVTNIDADHMETYGHDFGEAQEGLRRLPAPHAVLRRRPSCAPTTRRCASIVPQVSCPVTSYGFGEDAQVRAVNVRAVGGQMHFTAQRRNGVTLPDLDIVLNLPGEHNVRNALSVIAVAVELSVPDDAVQRGLADFKGVGRRFQSYGDVAGQGAIRRAAASRVIDDYGHHPVEMAATIAAARGAFPGRRLVLAFQPHRYTRTRDCFEDFVKVIGTGRRRAAGRGLRRRRGAHRGGRRPLAGARAARGRQGRAGVRRRHRGHAAGHPGQRARRRRRDLHGRRLHRRGARQGGRDSAAAGTADAPRAAHSREGGRS